MFFCVKQLPVLQMAEILQVEFSGVLCQIDGVHILQGKQLSKASVNRHGC